MYIYLAFNCYYTVDADKHRFLVAYFSAFSFLQRCVLISVNCVPH